MKKKPRVLFTHQMSPEQRAHPLLEGIHVENVPLTGFRFPGIELEKLLPAKADCWMFTSEKAAIALSRMNIELHPPEYVFAIGETTQKAIRNLGIVSAVPEVRNSEELAAFILSGNVSDIIHFCGNNRRSEAKKLFMEAGVRIREIEVYETVYHPQKISLDGIDAIVFMSPATAKCFFESNTLPDKIRIFAIGKTTASYLKDARGIDSGVPEKPTFEALIQHINQSLLA